MPTVLNDKACCLEVFLILIAAPTKTAIIKMSDIPLKSPIPAPTIPSKLVMLTASTLKITEEMLFSAITVM